MIAKFVSLEFELFPKPSDSDFLRIHQHYSFDLMDTKKIKIFRVLKPNLTN